MDLRYDRIDNLTASGEINALMAIHVMNVKKLDPEAWRILKQFLKQRSEIYDDYSGEFVELENGFIAFPPNYLSDSNAIYLIETIAAKYNVSVQITYKKRNYWAIAAFGAEGIKVPGIDACGDTMPLALCRLALKLAWWKEYDTKDKTPFTS